MFNMCLPSLNYKKKNYLQIGVTVKGRDSGFSTTLGGLFMTFSRRSLGVHRRIQIYFVENQRLIAFQANTLLTGCGKRLFCALINRKALKTLKQ